MTTSNNPNNPSVETFKRPLLKGTGARIFAVYAVLLVLILCMLVYLFLTGQVTKAGSMPSTLLVGIAIILMFCNWLHYIVTTDDQLIFKNSVFSSKETKVRWDNIQEITFYHPSAWSIAYAKVLLKGKKRPFMVYLDTVPPESFERFFQICRSHGVALSTPKREKWLRRHPEVRR